ncbi:MAG: hypothetical protein A2017_09990 [Lentisphaerae bacterium GWF2_44_16]|nr:MAG: hypothetical protein A2017_09990 [Lentisphaerae bacterium GWF2_44_16]
MTENNNVNNDIDLTQFDEEYASAEVEKRNFEPIPDGKYQISIDRLELTHTKETNNPMLKWTLKIIAPTHQGRLLWKNNVMASAENLKWLKSDLHTCGLDLEKLSELPGNLEKLLDVKLEITKRTRGENENIYFNRRIVTDDIPATNTGETENADTDDIPF